MRDNALFIERQREACFVSWSNGSQSARVAGGEKVVETGQ